MFVVMLLNSLLPRILSLDYAYCLIIHVHSKTDVTFVLQRNTNCFIKFRHFTRFACFVKKKNVSHAPKLALCSKFSKDLGNPHIFRLKF